MESFAAFLDVSAVEPEVNIQLPTEVWSDSWGWGVDIKNLDAVLAKVPQETKSPVSSQRISSEGWESENSPQSSFVESFNSVPCESLGYSFNSIPASRSGELGGPQIQATNAGTGQKEKKPKKKVQSGQVAAQVDDKDLDYKKYKTRLCRNWQQTGKCPYGESCVYAHGTREVRGEQENEAVVSSLSKLADQLAKQMGALGQLNTPLRPLRYRKPKAGKKAAKGPEDGEPYTPQHPQMFVPSQVMMDMYNPVAYYGHPWGQA
eukprot:EG_transcript_1469